MGFCSYTWLAQLVPSEKKEMFCLIWGVNQNFPYFSRRRNANGKKNKA